MLHLQRVKAGAGEVAVQRMGAGQFLIAVAARAVAQAQRVLVAARFVVRGAQQHFGGRLRLPQQAGAQRLIARARHGAARERVAVPVILPAVAQRQARSGLLAQRRVQHAFGQMLAAAARLAARAALPAPQLRLAGADVDGPRRAVAAKERALRPLEHFHLLHIQRARPHVAHAHGRAVDVHDDRVVVAAALVERADAAYAHVGVFHPAPGIDFHARRAAQHVFQAGQAAFLQLRLIQHIHRKGQLLHLLANLPRLHRHGRQRGGFITFCAARPGLSRLGFVLLRQRGQGRQRRQNQTRRRYRRKGRKGREGRKPQGARKQGCLFHVNLSPQVK